MRPYRHDWADDDELEETSTELPPPQKITNKDGSTTIIEYRLNDNGQKVKTTRRIRYITHREVVNPRVADRKSWAKFGLSAKDGAGPAPDTTSVGENIIFKPSFNWRQDAKDESKDPNAQAMKDKLKDKKVKCRICNGEHFTARCPYKDTMAPIGEAGAAADAAASAADEAAAASQGAAGAGKKGSYVPPALRGAGGAAAAGERMGGKYGERDDLATLRVTNVRFSPFSLRRRERRGRRRKRRRRKEWEEERQRLFCFLRKGFYDGTMRANMLFYSRSPRWPRNKSFAICSSGSVASLVSSLPRIAIRVLPRASLSSASRIAATLSRHAPRWTVSVSGI